MKKRWFGTKVKSYSSKITLEQLEERIVLDASVPATSVDNPDNPDNAQVEQQAEQAHTPDAQNAPTQAAADAATSADPLGDLYTGDSAQVLMSTDLANVESVSTEALRAVVVSSDIRDGADLVAAVQDNVITITYDAANANTESILSAIESALDGKVVDSLGFITHDDGAGAFALTQDVSVSFNTLTSDASLQDFWSAVGAFVQPDGRIDIMACDVASTDAGLDLVAQLESITGRNVAASADDTGNDLFGGNWELETDNVSLVPAYFDPYAVQFFDGVLDAPSASGPGATVEVAEDGLVSIILTGTDGDNLGVDPVSFAISDGVDHGSLTTTGVVTYDADTHVYSQTFVYDPADDYYGSDSFKFTFTSEGQTTTDVTVGIDVTPVNDAPVAVNNSVTATEDTVFNSFTAANFTFSDVDNLAMESIKITSLPGAQHGTLKLASGGSEADVSVNQEISAADIANLKFYPALNNTTSASFGFQVFDGTAWSANTATMTVNVNAVNDGDATISGTTGMYYTVSTTTPVSLGGITVGSVGADPVKVTLSVQDPSVYNVVGLLTDGTNTGESLTYQGTNVSGWLDTISFVPKAGYGQDVKIDLRIEDGDANQTQTFTIEANHAPAFQDPTDDFGPAVTVEYDLGQYSVYLPDLRVDEFDTGDTLSVKITLANKDAGELTTRNNMFGGSYNSTTGVWTLTNASVATVNNALNNMVFMPDGDNHVNTFVTVKVWDVHMAEAQATTQVVNLNVGAFVNFPDSVVNFYNTGNNIDIDTIAVFDPGVNDYVTVTLTLSDATAGTLSITPVNPLPSDPGYSVVKIGANVWKISGDRDDVNSTLTSLQYDPSKEQSNTLAIKVSYEGENGTETHQDVIQLAFVDDQPGVNDQLEASFFINGQAVSIASAPQEVKYQEGHTNIYIPAITVTDDDAAKFSVKLTLTPGTPLALDQNIVEDLGYIQTYDISKNLTRTVNTSGSAEWTLTNLTSAEINGVLGHIKFMPVGDNDRDATLAVTIYDTDTIAGAGATSIATAITLNVTPTNDQPVFSDLPESVITFNDGELSGFYVRTSMTQTNLVTDATTTIYHPIEVSDPDSGLEQVTVKVTLSEAGAGTLSSIGGGSYNSTTGVWTMTDLVSNVNTALAQLFFDPSTNPQSVTLTVEVNDGGENGAGTTTEYIQLQFTPDDPVANLPLSGSFSINGQNVALTTTPSVDYEEGFSNIYLPAIVVSDDDAGQLLTATFTGVSSSVGTLETYGVADAIVGGKLEGLTVSEMNYALSHLKFMPGTDNDRDATLTVTIKQVSLNGTAYVDVTGANSDPVTANILLNVVPTNDQPVFSQFPASVIGLNDGVSSLPIVTSGNYIQVSDVDTSEVIIVTLTLSDKTAGSLGVTSDPDGLANGSYTVNNTVLGVVTITGDQLGVNNALKTLVYNNTGDVSNGIRVEVKDGGEDYTGIRSGYIELQFNADDPLTNDPVGLSFTTSSVEYDEDYANVYLPALVVSNDDVGQNLNATFTLSNSSVGSIQTYFGAKPLTGGSGGVWSLSSVTLDQLNFALSHLKFMPAADNDVDANLTITVTDIPEAGTATTKTAIIELNVNPINDQPVFSDLPATVITYTEGATSVPIVASGATHRFDIGDADTGEYITATIRLSDLSTGKVKIGTAESVNGELKVEGTVADIEGMLNDQLVFVPLPNNETNTYITVSIQDGGENGTIVMTERFSVVVEPVANAPVVVTAPDVGSPDTVNMSASAIELPNIVLSDADNDDEYTVTLSADIGRHYASIQRDGVADNLYDPATGKWEITGSLSQVNQALADVMFVPDNGFSVPAGTDGGTTVNVQIKDETGTTKNGKIWIVNNTSFFEML